VIENVKIHTDARPVRVEVLAGRRTLECKDEQFFNEFADHECHDQII
jgi:hypothetical protein